MSDERSEFVVKESASRLCRNDRILIDTIQNSTLQKSMMGVFGSIHMVFMVAQCINAGLSVPSNFLNQKFLYEMFNWDWDADRASFAAVRDAKNGIDQRHRFHQVNDMRGKGWMRGYLVKMYAANVKACLPKKVTRAIKTTIYSQTSVTHQGQSRRFRQRVMKETRRRIFNPSRPAAADAPVLDQALLDLVDFHRVGLHLQGQDTLYEDHLKRESLLHHFVTHLGQCLHRQCQLETAHSITVKKTLPLPMFGIGNRNSIELDKRGLYYILKDYQGAGGHTNRPNLPALPTAEKRMTSAMYFAWMKEMFNIDDVIKGSKVFASDGVGVTLDGVNASVHFIKLDPNGNVQSDDDEDDDYENLNNLHLLNLNEEDEEDEDDEDEEDISSFHARRRAWDLDDEEDDDDDDDDDDDTMPPLQERSSYGIRRVQGSRVQGSGIHDSRVQGSRVQGKVPSGDDGDESGDGDDGSNGGGSNGGNSEDEDDSE